MQRRPALAVDRINISSVFQQHPCQPLVSMMRRHVQRRLPVAIAFVRPRSMLQQHSREPVMPLSRRNMQRRRPLRLRACSRLCLGSKRPNCRRRHGSAAS